MIKRYRWNGREKNARVRRKMEIEHGISDHQHFIFNISTFKRQLNVRHPVKSVKAARAVKAVTTVRTV